MVVRICGGDERKCSAPGKFIEKGQFAGGTDRTVERVQDTLIAGTLGRDLGPATFTAPTRHTPHGKGECQRNVRNIGKGVRRGIGQYWHGTIKSLEEVQVLQSLMVEQFSAVIGKINHWDEMTKGRRREGDNNDGLEDTMIDRKDI